MEQALAQENVQAQADNAAHELTKVASDRAKAVKEVEKLSESLASAHRMRQVRDDEIETFKNEKLDWDTKMAALKRCVDESAIQAQEADRKMTAVVEKCERDTAIANAFRAIVALNAAVESFFSEGCQWSMRDRITRFCKYYGEYHTGSAHHNQCHLRTRMVDWLRKQRNRMHHDPPHSWPSTQELKQYAQNARDLMAFICTVPVPAPRDLLDV